MGLGGLRKAMGQAEDTAKAFRAAPRDKMMRPADEANKALRSALVRTRRMLNSLDEAIKDTLHKGIK